MFMKKLIILISLIALNLSQSTDNSEEEIVIRINKSVYKKILEEQEIQQRARELIIKEREDQLQDAILTAYKNAASMIIMNFGTKVNPALKDLAPILDLVNVNDQCNQDCALNCVHSYGPMIYWNQTCLSECSCYFLYDNYTQEELQKIADPNNTKDITRKIEELSVSIMELARNATQSVKPAYRDWKNTSNYIHHEMEVLRRSQAIQNLQCDQTCIDQCSLDSQASLFACLSQCSCQKIHISVEEVKKSNKTINMTSTPQTWQLFKRYLN